jgi:hypothetical protein
LSLAPRPLLAFRPACAVQRLGRRSEACPLSLRHLLRALAGSRRALPLFAAGHPALARAALLAGKQGGAVVGLGLPPGSAPEGWFEAVTRAADELCPGHPIFLSALVAVQAGDGWEGSAGEAHRLVEAGLTHLALDVARLPMAERARAAAQVAAPAVEREIGVEVLLPGGAEPENALAFHDELAAWGLEPDALSVAGPSVASDAGSLPEQLRALAAVAAALAPTALVVRGPLGTGLAPALRVLGAAAVEDGGRLGEAAARALPGGGRELLAAGWGRGAAPPPLGAEEGERAEGMAFAEAAALIEALGAGGTAAAVAEALAGPAGDGR